MAWFCPYAIEQPISEGLSRGLDCVAGATSESTAKCVRNSPAWGSSREGEEFLPRAHFDHGFGLLFGLQAKFEGLSRRLE
jgi:hypothetical protein